VEEGITKYNLEAGTWSRPAKAARVILVPGQVESDTSIRYGAPGIATNMGLLQAVRQANPEAYLLYKPHPDVVAGLRRRGVGEEEALTWCDEVINEVPMGTLIQQVDEVHLLTSLAGFEALLRGKQVTCYGQPFYAGWGLTTDMVPIDRRTRRLALDELVAGALIHYPRYVGRVSGRPTTPEQALDELLAWRAQSNGQVTLWRRLKRVFLRRIVGVR
jgi:capsular polysaccharide export protein